MLRLFERLGLFVLLLLSLHTSLGLVTQRTPRFYRPSGQLRSPTVLDGSGGCTIARAFESERALPGVVETDGKRSTGLLGGRSTKLRVSRRVLVASRVGDRGGLSFQALRFARVDGLETWGS